MEITSLFSDLEKERAGEWEKYPLAPDAEFLIARIGTDAYNATLDRLKEPYREQIRRGTLPEDESKRIADRALSETVLIGWRGLTQKRGEKSVKLEYTPERAFELLSRPEAHDFRDWVVTCAMDPSRFRAGETVKGLADLEREETEKN